MGRRATLILVAAVTIALAAELLQLRLGAMPASAPGPRVRPPTRTAVALLAATASTLSPTAVATLTPTVARPTAPPTVTATPSSTPVPSMPTATPATPAPTTPRSTPTATPTAQPTRTPTAVPPTAILPSPTTPRPRSCAGAVLPCPLKALLPGTLLIADRGNNRLIEVNASKQIVWEFPRPGDLRPGQVFLGPDDAFFSPDWRTIITNQEEAQTLGLIDYRTHRLLWQYGHVYLRGRAPGYLNEPDDAYLLPNGLVTVADIRNCRILFISPRKDTIVRQYGRTGVCVHDPPRTFASPNGDTPLPDGGMLITEISGSHVVRLSARGRVIFDLTVPWVYYPSDAQLLADGSILLADYSLPGGIVRVSAKGRLLWRYTPALATDMLNHPSLAIMLPNGLIAANDDWNHRVVLIDPRRQTIVWQYGITGVPGSEPGYLDVPDGIDFHPSGR